VGLRRALVVGVGFACACKGFYTRSVGRAEAVR